MWSTEDLKVIYLPLKNIGEANSCFDQLEEVEVPICLHDLERYELNGWSDFREEYHRGRFLPKIADPLFFHSNNVVIPLVGRKWRIRIDWPNGHDYPYDNDDMFMANGKILVLEETNDPLTKPNGYPSECCSRGSYFQVFGQPKWIQGEYFPADSTGKPCRHLATFECGWGDSGNWNILVSLDEVGLPYEAFFEASCC